ncbi:MULTISPECIES: tyrosine-type recombinase/integrase [unclassified Peribacillus]|uniref:site-specific integrase n=1 Tax=unclassified Peribacillus TaxID=2675266 RepID=UPI00366E767D
MKGYVRKRGNKWSYTVDVGKDPITGTRKQKTKSGFKTKKEAENALNQLVYELNKGEWIAPKEILLGEFAEEWLKSYRHQLRDTTAEQYENKIRNWIGPLIGMYKVQELKPIHAQVFSGKLLESLNENTAHKVYSITKLIINHAVNLELINKNPFNNLSLVREQKRKVVTWSFDELEHFLKVVKNHHTFYYRIFVTAAYTGIRKGELLALTKDDIDWEKKRIRISKSVSETKKGVQLGELKTPSSHRNVAVDDFLISILKEQVIKNNEMKLKLSDSYNDQQLIFCHEDGVIFRPSSLNRIFGRYIERSGSPKIRFHDLRHTHASLLLELGVNPKIVSDRLGHSSIKITLDTYSHVSLDLQSDVADVFSKRARKV